MVFKSTVNELKKSIKVLLPIINHNHPTLAYRYFMLRFNKEAEKIEIKGYDDFTIGSSFVGCEKIEDISEDKFYILAKHFISLVLSFHSGDIKLVLEEDKCTLSCGKSTYILPTLDKVVAKEAFEDLDFDYYRVFTDKDKNFSDIKTDRFSVCFNSISHCLSKDDTHRNLQNIYFSNNKMIACDGTKGAVVDFDTKNIEGLMLHKKACDCILNANGSIAKIYKESDKVYGKAKDFIFVSSIEDDYPYSDIRDIIDSFDVNSFKFEIKIDPDEVIDKLSRVLLFADEDTSAVKITFDPEVLIIEVDNKSKAEEKVTVFENVKKNSFSLFLDGKKLKESLNKSLTESRWFTDSEDSVQYVYDGSLLQFFLGIE